MALKVLYDNKVAINANSSIPDINKVKDVDMNNIKTFLLYGWNLIENITFGLSVNDSNQCIISTSEDLRSILSVGMKIKLTNQSITKYFILTAITSTTITLFGGTDYSITTGTVTNVCYSKDKSPYGFPVDPSKWSVIVTDTTERSQVTVGTTIYNIGGISISIPIGLWNVKIKGLFQIGDGAGTANAKYMTISLSTANNTILPNNAIGIAGADIKFNRLYSEKTIDNLSLSSRTLYYLNARDDAGDGNTIYFLNGSAGGLTLYIIAVCAYL